MDINLDDPTLSSTIYLLSLRAVRREGSVVGDTCLSVTDLFPPRRVTQATQ